MKGRDGSFKNPRNGSMTQNTLSRNKRGQIVSKKKSKQGSKLYYRRDSKLRKWNETIARHLGRHKTFDPLYVDSDPPYVDFVPPNDDDSPYVPYVETGPRRSERTPKPNPPGSLTYHGARK